MTRQKKEIQKKIEEIYRFIAVDMQLGFGCVPANYYAPLHEEIYRLEEQLAKLRHFNSVEEMFYDERGCRPDPTIPFS